MSERNKIHKKELIICLGSACFSRGNKEAVQVIKNYIKEHQLEDKVHFCGTHCVNKCNEGPVIKFENKIYTEVNSDRLINILDEIFHKYL